MNLLNFILVAYGMTFIIVYGKIFEDIRPKKDYSKKCLGAGTTYLLSMLVNDYGARVSSRSGGDYVDD